MSNNKYMPIANTIRQRIRQQIYAPMTQLPDQYALAEEFGVSRMTVKKALDKLAQEGLINKQSGRGTMVLGDTAVASSHTPESQLMGLTQKFGADRVSSDVINFDVALPSTLIQTKLSLSEDDPVYVIDRVRKIDAIPRTLEHIFLPLKLVPGLTREVLSGSLYRYLSNDLQLHLTGAYRCINAASADTRDVQYLHAQLQEPVLEIKQQLWLNTGENIEPELFMNKQKYGATS